MRRPARPAAGFTLVEVLVVVVIIGIVIAGAVLSMSFMGTDRQLAAEGDRLASLINYAEEQASLQTRELGLYCALGSYVFLIYDPRQNLWLPIGVDEALRARNLPGGLQLALNVDGQDVVLKDHLPPLAPPATPVGSAPADASLMGSAPGAPGASPPAVQPQVMIYSNGDLSTFRIRLTREGTDRFVQVQPDARGIALSSEPQAGAP